MEGKPGISDVVERFNGAAEKYDPQRRFFIPCFDDFYETSISFLASIRSDFRSILDLGAGTGLLTKYLYEHFKPARFTLVDVAEMMLEVARQRFHGLDAFTYAVCDYSREFPAGTYDLVASALSIHHLEDEAKANLYRAIYNALEEKGWFINLDQFNSGSAYIEEYYNKWWYEFIKRSGITQGEEESMRKRRELDKENTIDETKQLLKDAGFSHVECIYNYMKFGVLIAGK